MLQEGRRIDLDLARRGLESPRVPAAIGLGVFAVTGREPDLHAPRSRLQVVERHSRRAELMAIGRLDVAAPEGIAETETAREVEHDFRIRAASPGRNDRLPELNPRLRFGADFEADLQCLVLERRGGRQDDVRQLGRGIHEQVGMRVEFQRCQGLASPANLGVRQEKVGPEAEQAANRIGLLFEDGAIEVTAGDVVPARRPERPFGEAEGGASRRAPANPLR